MGGKLDLHMPRADNKPPVRAKVGAPTAPAPALTDALAEAGWVEADQALAAAIVEFGQLQRALSECEIAGAAKMRARAALSLTAQALARASRRRGLVRVGELGAIVPFARTQHALARPQTETPERVEIVSEGVMRGDEVLVPALVKPARSRRKKAR